MKLTKLQLKQIIEEELKKVFSEIEVVQGEPVDVAQRGRATSSTARKQMRGRAKEVGGQGISDQERGLIDALGDQLLAAAKVDNIVIGEAFRYAKLLSMALIKIMSKSQSQEGGDLPQETSRLQDALKAVEPDVPPGEGPRRGAGGGPSTAAQLRGPGGQV